jgi:lauroyl/myristoyl acyltransferase
MDALLYLLARSLLAVVQALPLGWAARLGRWGGGLFYLLDARHRRVALKNLTLCFGAGKTPQEICAIARENFRRIGENFACAARTAGMSSEEIRTCLEVVGADKLHVGPSAGRKRSYVAAIGHFGNFELYARANLFVEGLQCATTYRGLRQPALNRLLQDLRAQSGCLFFERRTDVEALKTALHRGNLLIGFLADQHAGDRGLGLPFFGHECSTSVAPAVFALRYDCPVHPAICYRVALGRWRVEIGEAIPTHEGGQPRPVAAITLAINRAFEVAVRRDPANWFWVHNRWKPGKWRQRGNRGHASSSEAMDSAVGAKDGA